jgi:hypothetical protein
VKTFFIIVRHIFNRKIHLLRKKNGHKFLVHSPQLTHQLHQQLVKYIVLAVCYLFFLLYFQSAETISQYDRNTSEIVYNIVMKMI